MLFQIKRFIPAGEVMKYDIIGDIHGYADQAARLLEILGYQKVQGHYQHPELDRKAIF